eukprot:Gb_04471 [translate_table: standard]
MVILFQFSAGANHSSTYFLAIAYESIPNSVNTALGVARTDSYWTIGFIEGMGKALLPFKFWPFVSMLALIETYSQNEDVALDHRDGMIVPYIIHQNAETGQLLPNPLSSISESTKNNFSKPVRRSSRNTTKQSANSAGSVSVVIEGQCDGLQVAERHLTRRSTKRKQRTDTPEVLPLLNEKQKTCQSPLLYDESLNASSEANLEAVNPEAASAVDANTGKLLTPKRNQRKRGSQWDNVSASKGKKAYGGGKQRICKGTAETQQEVGNPSGCDSKVKPETVSYSDISASALKKRKSNNKNMRHEANTPKGYAGIEREITKSTIPSVDLDVGEKIFTITVPHLEYIGQSSGHKDSNGRLHGKASLKGLKLLAYHSVLQALYLQGAHNWKHEVLLTNLRETLDISNEEHSTELRRITTAHYD